MKLQLSKVDSPKSEMMKKFNRKDSKTIQKMTQILHKLPKQVQISLQNQKIQLKATHSESETCKETEELLDKIQKLKEPEWSMA